MPSKRSKAVLPPTKQIAPLPESASKALKPFAIDTPGSWWVLSDVHIPFHDCPTLETSGREAKRRGCKGVLINGDLLDSHHLSRHDKDPSAPRYTEEIESAKQFLAWLRGLLPKARIVFKGGNHDARLERYVYDRAESLFGLEGLNLQSLLHLDQYGVEWVEDLRVVNLGKLNVVHGHEYCGGGGVNPARWLYLKARSVAMVGHFHRTSEHHSRDIRGKAEAAWSVGCCCTLSPRFLPLNEWNHGVAYVEVDGKGEFHVENRRLIAGQFV